MERLSPKLVIVSSDPDGPHDLPDLIGTVIFMDYSEDHTVALTSETGTIKVTVGDAAGLTHTVVAYREGPTENVLPRQEAQLPATDWAAIVRSRFQ